VTSLALQLLDVLAAAHEKAIVHRDLKPANLFLTVDGSLKVLDFGIARLRDALGSSEHATRTGTLMGTPAFMAPEQAQAIAAEIDGQTDLWAVGATMYTLLSGQLVHDGDNSSQLLIRAGTSRAGPLLAVAPRVEPAIAAVVDRALTFEKAGRWPTAGAMREALLAASVVAFGSAPGRDSLTGVLENAAGGTEVQGLSGSAETEVAGSPSYSGAAHVRTPHAGGGGGGGGGGSVLPPSGTSGGRTNPQPLSGLSTGNGLSAVAASAHEVRKPKPWPMIVTALAVLVTLGTLAYTFTKPGSAPSPVAVQPPAPPSAPVSPVASAAPPPPPLPSPPPAATPAAVASAPPPVEAPTPPVSPIATARAPKVGGAVAVASKPAGAKPAATAAPDCTSPFTLDSDGNKKWKKECLDP
jgi:serine/threonine-protein kinase